jgi:hypothetical protein
LDAAAACGLEAELWVLEGERLAMALACASGQTLEAEQIELVSAPAGVELVRGELRWTPGFDQAANHVIELKIRGAERGEIRVGVGDRFEHPDNVPPVDPLRYTHELGLPVFHLGTADDVNGDGYTPVSLVYAGKTYQGAQAKYRGATSSKYPKRSFTLKLDTDTRFSDAAHKFYDVRRLVLTTTFDDNSQIRQRLAFELWNRLDKQHITIQHFNAVVYLNGHYHGVYAVTDHINDDFLESQSYPSNVNVYKARQQDANFRLTSRTDQPKTNLVAGYTKEEGYPPAGEAGAYDDLTALVSWIATASDEEFREQLPEQLAPDFEHWFILVSLIAAVDTTAKNYFLVHDSHTDAPDRRWRFVPWDFNASFGQNYRTERRTTDQYNLGHFQPLNRLFERLTSDPPLRAKLMARYRGALAEAASSEQVVQALERFAAEVSAAAVRDELRWDEAHREYFSRRNDFLSHGQEIEYLRAWIPARWGALADQLDP